jgi:hypothetical protein
MTDQPTPQQTVAALRHYNAWRRDNNGRIPPPDPTELGKTIEGAATMIERQSHRIAQLERTLAKERNHTHTDTATLQVLRAMRNAPKTTTGATATTQGIPT